jgi:hypothetical protein
MNATMAAAILVFSLAVGIQQKKLASQEIQSSHDMSSCPMHEQHKAAAQDAHQQGVIERGDHVMGFSHDKATHHFALYPDGGAIDVLVNKPEDAATRDAIRSHFIHIVKMFAEGDFSAPMLIHSQNPPGTEAMKQLRGQIQYRLENTASGARIRITTKNAGALRAVHTFLRFQIRDHQTADSQEVAHAP